jgi:hypothetical protein
MGSDFESSDASISPFDKLEQIDEKYCSRIANDIGFLMFNLFNHFKKYLIL